VRGLLRGQTEKYAGRGGARFPRTLRNMQRCASDPGSSIFDGGPGSAAQKCFLVGAGLALASVSRRVTLREPIVREGPLVSAWYNSLLGRDRRTERDIGCRSRC